MPAEIVVTAELSPRENTGASGKSDESNGPAAPCISILENHRQFRGAWWRVYEDTDIEVSSHFVRRKGLAVANERAFS